MKKTTTILTMKPVFGALLVLLACAYQWGCADVQERSHIVGGRTGTPLTAGVGDTVLRVSHEKNLPNIVGKADIFGRTTPTGVETVQYLGVKDGRAFFERRTVNVETGATTMNSTPLVIPNTATTTHSGSVMFTVQTAMATALILAPPQRSGRPL